MKRLCWAFILAFMPAGLSALARANTIIFSDQDLSDADWAILDSVFMDPVQTDQRLEGGGPGADRQLGLNFAERQDYAPNLNVIFVYESIGAIDNDGSTLTVSPTPLGVPEPDTLVLLGSGLLSLAGLCRLIPIFIHLVNTHLLKRLRAAVQLPNRAKRGD